MVDYRVVRVEGMRFDVLRAAVEDGKGFIAFSGRDRRGFVFDRDREHNGRTFPCYRIRGNAHENLAAIGLLFHMGSLPGAGRDGDDVRFYKVTAMGRAYFEDAVRRRDRAEQRKRDTDEWTRAYRSR